MENSKKDILQLIITIISLILATIEIENEVFRIIVTIGIVLAAITVITMFIVRKIKFNKNLSNTAVISKSKKYTKMFKKLLKANEKALKKYINVRGFKRLEKLNKEVVRKMNFTIDLDKEKADALYSKLHEAYEDYYSNKRLQPKKLLLKLVPCCSEQQSYEIYKIVQKNIASLRRILLQLEQHDLRISFGEFVVKYSLDIKEQIESYLDDIGWTYILLGNNKKGLEVIRMAMNLIDYKLASLSPKINNKNELSSDDEKLYYELLLLKARALRHLGTTYYTYKSEKDNVKTYLTEALDIVYEANFKKFYLEFDGDPKEKSRREKTYWSMTNGVEYNLMLYKYYRSLKYKDIDVNDLKTMYADVSNMIQGIEDAGLSDKHRYVKLKSFKCQLYTSINDLQFKAENPSTVAKDLKDIESILNSNIYFDKALEVYLYEKVEKAYDDSYEIFNVIK